MHGNRLIDVGQGGSNPTSITGAPFLVLLMLLGSVGCTGLQVRHEARSPSQLQIDGLELADRRANTTLEVVSLLGLQTRCRQDTPACADAILDAPGTVREGNRLLAAADVLRRTADGTAASSDRESVWLACAGHTWRYLHEPGLAGREPAISARSQLALRLHNACTAGYAKERLAAQGPAALTWAVDLARFPAVAVQQVDMAREIAIRGLATRQVQDGLGVAAVASGHTRGIVESFPDQPFALAISIRFDRGPDGRPRLLASDASRGQSTDTVFGPIPLARDMSAAYALAAAAFEAEAPRFGGLFEDEQDRTPPQIRLLAPIDAGKTPVILIHGLASSPITWANMVNALLGDPDLSENYQFWLARYSTAQPVLVNRQQLAHALEEFRGKAAQRSGPLPPAVLVGHSMGGVIARMLVTDSGLSLWNAAFTTYPGHFPPDSRDGAQARALFLFDPIADVDEVVFIAAPHGGSDMADGWFGRLVQRFVGTPAATLDYLIRMTSRNPVVVQPELRENYLAGGPSSLGTLSPGQSVTRAGRQLAVAPGVRIHSIIGIKDHAHPERGDGVVLLESASWPQGSTHLVDGEHDLQTEPATIDILKRILLDRLEARAVDGETPTDHASETGERPNGP